MKQISLIQLDISNFKGIRNFSLSLDGGNADIYGDNATGKTSVYDAFLWLLFGKDSTGRKSFSIKPLDANGKVRDPGIETCVEAVFRVDGRALALGKKYHEVWTRKRGQDASEFSGNTCDHFIDGVPKAAGEYGKTVEALIAEGLFRAITNPRMFNSMDKQGKRQLLLDMTGDLDFSSVLQDEFPALVDEMRGRTAEDVKRILQQQIKKENKLVKELPVRIDEALRGIDESAEGTDIDGMLRTLYARKTEAERSVQVPDSTRQAELESEVRSITAQIQALRSENELYRRERIRAAQARNDAEISKRRAVLNEVLTKQASLESAMRREQMERDVETHEMDLLRRRWNAAHAREWEGSEICPTCNQPLPAAQIDSARRAFNKEKLSEKERLNQRGCELKRSCEERQKRIAQIEAQLTDMRQRAAEAQSALNEVNQISIPDATTADMPGYTYQLSELEKERSATKGSLESIMNANAEAALELNAQTHVLENEIAEALRLQTKQANNRAIRKRVEELRAEHKAAGARLEQAESLLINCEAYIQRCMELTEERIAGLFKIVRFKLFEYQNNGGIADICTATVDGIPYEDLNNAMQINAGLDIIGALSRHYGVSAPIFIDNAESINRLHAPEGTQIVRLIVSGDKQLRIEKLNWGQLLPIIRKRQADRPQKLRIKRQKAA